MKRRRRLVSSEHDPAREGVQSSARAEDARASSGGAAEPNAGAESGGGAKDETAKNRRSVRAFLIAAVQAAVVIPVLYYLRFGEINAYALSFTGFMVALCLLVALGYSIPDGPASRAEAAPAKVGAVGRVGSFWLLACAFGPFFGWLVTQAFTLTEENWRWRYCVRVALCVGLPVLTALPLFAYVRGKYGRVALPLLLCVTALPVWSGLNTILDLREGPTVRSTTGLYDAQNNSFRPAADGGRFTLKTLAHTGRVIKIEPAAPVERKD
jgi:hypothetical protein